MPVLPLPPSLYLPFIWPPPPWLPSCSTSRWMDRQLSSLLCMLVNFPLPLPSPPQHFPPPRTQTPSVMEGSFATNIPPTQRLCPLLIVCIHPFCVLLAVTSFPCRRWGFIFIHIFLIPHPLFFRHLLFFPRDSSFFLYFIHDTFCCYILYVMLHLWYSSIVLLLAANR
ncbi:hypothetical protein CPB84DRAFT_863970 [Gymnopilus junonius]|uniref:Uncharacterized protein n=1 Tax=Gymnopilus junonius TaxID=109634 RepID=A0A9P5TPC6_GYMJU|nr:hypothetical protein CPB84DRAFT_863970 [Gymnopilus junonius]